MTIFLVSLRCNPAFLQHLIAYAKAMRELGFEPAFLLDPAYKRFSELEPVAPILEACVPPRVPADARAIFFNPSLKNRSLAAALKHQGAQVIYIYHEPWQFSLAYLYGEGMLATLRAILAHRFTTPVLKLADEVIVESQYGLQQYSRSDIKFNSNPVYFPQIYDDDAKLQLDTQVSQKVYFSYIGNPCRAHGFDQFLGFVRYAILHGVDLRFLIASRHELPSTVYRDPALTKGRKKIEIRCGRPLSNQEMNRCYAESYCVWNVYRRSTQSGVLPKAFMFGAPVLASRIGSFPEYVAEGFNGRFVSGDDPEAILAATAEFRNNQERYFTNCRKSFLETFYYRAKLRELRIALEGVRST